MLRLACLCAPNYTDGMFKLDLLLLPKDRTANACLVRRLELPFVPFDGLQLEFPYVVPVLDMKVAFIVDKDWLSYDVTSGEFLAVMFEEESMFDDYRKVGFTEPAPEHRKRLATHILPAVSKAPKK
jgi:hypothetical protein